MNQPWLIQRATIRKPLVSVTETLSSSVQFDYMGSSEFEFGALPQSLRRIEKNMGNLAINVMPSIVEGEAPLRVLHYFTTLQDIAAYKEFLTSLRTSSWGAVHLKERSEFNIEERAPRVKLTPTGRKAKHQPYTREYADFWWDLDNDVMFSFNEAYMNQLERHLEASFTLMNSKA